MLMRNAPIPIHQPMTTPTQTVAIVQARMGSTRLPGKTLADVGGQSLLRLVLLRLMAARTLDTIVVATTAADEDDAIETEVSKLGLPCVRGHSWDVLARFRQAAHEYPGHLFVRVCADNPFVDPRQVDSLVRFERDGGYDLAYNHRPECGLPDGVGAEVVTDAVLDRLDTVAVAQDHREHVTLYAYDHPDEFRLGALVSANVAGAGYRLDVDYPEDLEFVRALYAALPGRSAPLWSTRTLVRILDKHPDLPSLRRQRIVATATLA